LSQNSTKYYTRCVHMNVHSVRKYKIQDTGTRPWKHGRRIQVEQITFERY
jgi:hypothetical protein